MQRLHVAPALMRLFPGEAFTALMYADPPQTKGRSGGSPKPYHPHTRGDASSMLVSSTHKSTPCEHTYRQLPYCRALRIHTRQLPESLVAPYAAAFNTCIACTITQLPATHHATMPGNSTAKPCLAGCWQHRVSREMLPRPRAALQALNPKPCQWSTSWSAQTQISASAMQQLPAAKGMQAVLG